MNTGQTLAVLHVIAPNQIERTVAITFTPFCMGRSPHNDLVLSDESVARRHACLRLEGTQILLIDLGSETGTWLGQTRLSTYEANVLNYQDIFTIGPYQLWLEPVAGAGPIGVGEEDTFVRAGSAPPSFDPRLIESSPNGRVGVLLKTPQATITPGSTTTVALIVLNQDASADRLRIKVAGVPEPWVSTSTPLIELPPGGRQEVNLVIAPPRTSENLAGQYTLLIQVTSQTALTETVEVRAILTMVSYTAFSSVLQPPRIGVDEVARVVIRNDSNVQQRFTLAWRDPERLFEFRPAAGQMTLAAGQTAAAEFRAISYRKRWFGGQEIKVYTVQVTGQDGESQTHTGQIVTEGLLPMWVPLAALILAVCTFGAVLWSASLLAAPSSGTPTPTLTATPIGVDSDGDGLSDADEARLGSDPHNPDTDHDGLSDLEEFRRGTSLTLPDTDGDGLLDGQEVRGCTDPRNPDTDGDGLRDNVDPDPCRPPTATPPATANPSATPAPTYTPLPTYTLPPTWTPLPPPTWTPLPPPPTWTPIPSPTPTTTPTLTPTATSLP